MFGRPVLRYLRHLASLPRRAQFITRFLPAERWFAAAARMAQLQWAACRLIWWRPDITLRNAVFLDLLLLELTQYGPFPIPSQILGTDLLPRNTAEALAPGVIYCTAHVPLFSTQVRILEEAGSAPRLVIALSGAIGPDGRYPVPGTADRVAALPPGAKTLVRLRRELQAGKLVGSLVDEYAGGPLKPQLFRLAGKVGAKVLFVFSELQGTRVKLTVELPPFPFCCTDEEVEANLQAFDAHRQRVLAAFHGKKQNAQPRPGKRALPSL